MGTPKHGCAIIPDDVLKKIEENAPTIEQRNAARRSLAISQNLRAKRAASVEPQQGEQREVYDSKNTPEQGEKVRGEDEPETGDEGVDLLYDDAGRWFDAVADRFGWSSYDGQNATMITVAHFEKNFDNAYWDGTGIWVGDGFFFHPFYLSQVVTFHEWTHALIEKTLRLVYLRQAGALNEHLADAWAAALEQRFLGDTATSADWLIGRELFGGRVQGRALRDMMNPGTAYNDPMIGQDPQTKHMRDYYAGPQDNYGVHINSGIPNRAFALAAHKVGGMVDETLLPVVWQVMIRRLVGQQATFQEYANAMAVAAVEVASPAVQDAILYGWEEVGITIGDAPTPPPPPESPCRLTDGELMAAVDLLRRHPDLMMLSPVLHGLITLSDEEIVTMLRNPVLVEAAMALAAMPQARRFMAVARFHNARKA